MTLDEAIAKAKADGNVQLAEWLRQARGADAAARWYTEKLRDAHRTIRKLQNENAKLRELATLNWEWAHSCCGNNCKMQTEECGYGIDRECNYEREIYDRMRELGVPE